MISGCDDEYGRKVAGGHNHNNPNPPLTKSTIAIMDFIMIDTIRRLRFDGTQPAREFLLRFEQARVAYLDLHGEAHPDRIRNPRLAAALDGEADDRLFYILLRNALVDPEPDHRPAVGVDGSVFVGAETWVAKNAHNFDTYLDLSAAIAAKYAPLPRGEGTILNELRKLKFRKGESLRFYVSRFWAVEGIDRIPDNVVVEILLAHRPKDVPKALATMRRTVLDVSPADLRVELLRISDQKQHPGSRGIASKIWSALKRCVCRVKVGVEWDENQA